MFSPLGFLFRIKLKKIGRQAQKMKNMKGIQMKKIIVGTAESNKLFIDLLDPTEPFKELNDLFI